MNINSFKKCVKKNTVKAKEITENTVKYAKYKMKLSELGYEIETKYTEIGKLIYESDSYEAYPEEIISICEEISKYLEEIKTVQNSLNDISNKKICPICGNKSSSEDSFCPKCGYGFKDE